MHYKPHQIVYFIENSRTVNEKIIECIVLGFRLDNDNCNPKDYSFLLASLHSWVTHGLSVFDVRWVSSKAGGIYETRESAQTSIDGRAKMDAYMETLGKKD